MKEHARRIVSISIWYTKPSQPRQPREIAGYRALLSEAERACSERFRFDEDRNTFIVAHALVRLALSSRCPDVAPSAWRFEPNAYGRPEIASPRSPLRFSLSHTSGVAACAVTHDRDVGVDVEKLTQSAPLDVAQQFFSAQEAAELVALPDAMRTERFFEYWTLKESYVKARGLGLRLPLDQFSFRVVPGSPITISFDAGCVDDPRLWHFWSQRLNGTHLLALAVRQEGAPPSPEWREI